MKPTLHNMRLDDPEQAIQNPALASLLTAGWQVAASFVGERGGHQELVLMLTPPPEPQWPRRLFATLTLATALGAAVGAVVAATALSWLA